METKKARVEQYLIDNGSITPLEAILEFWAMRLSGIIYKLKEEGWQFSTTMVKHKSGSHFAKYSLVALPIGYYDEQPK